MASTYVALAENNASFATAQIHGATGGKVLL